DLWLFGLRADIFLDQVHLIGGYIKKISFTITDFQIIIFYSFNRKLLDAHILPDTVSLMYYIIANAQLSEYTNWPSFMFARAFSKLPSILTIHLFVTYYHKANGRVFKPRI